MSHILEPRFICMIAFATWRGKCAHSISFTCYSVKSRSIFLLEEKRQKPNQKKKKKGVTFCRNIHPRENMESRSISVFAAATASQPQTVSVVSLHFRRMARWLENATYYVPEVGEVVALLSVVIEQRPPPPICLITDMPMAPFMVDHDDFLQVAAFLSIAEVGDRFYLQEHLHFIVEARQDDTLLLSDYDSNDLRGVRLRRNALDTMD